MVELGWLAGPNGIYQKRLKIGVQKAFFGRGIQVLFKDTGKLVNC
jgi:hypothetical protein